MNWDPITRIVGSLGIFTKIDFDEPASGGVPQHFFDLSRLQHFHEGQRSARRALHHQPHLRHLRRQPRDLRDLCAEHGVRRAASRHGANGSSIWRSRRVHVRSQHFPGQPGRRGFLRADGEGDQSEGVWQKPESTAAPHSELHGFRTIADIMRALNPFTGSFYLEALQMSRMTREMFCLMEGRHVHPSTLYPGGVGTVPTVQLFTDYIVRLMKYVEFMKKVLPLHDDLFDFFYDALPGYEEVGRRRVLLGCWGSFNDPEHCDYTYKNMTNWGRKMFVTPGMVVDGKLVTTDLVDINLNIRILLGSSYYDDWKNAETFVKTDPLGNPVDKNHPWNQTTIPRPQKRDFGGKYTWVMSPRWLDKRTGDHLALDTGGGPIARLWSTALAGLVDIGYIKSTGKSVKIYLPKTATKPEVEFEWKIPKWSNAIERDRARTYFQAYAAACALHFAEKALAELHAGNTKTWSDFKVPEEAIGCGFHEAVRGVLSHHVVIRKGKIANYHPYPPTPWNANPRDIYGTPGPYEDAVQNTPIFEENGPDKFKGIDIMRAVRSFDPCLPCGVHMYLGGGKVLKTHHSPMFGVHS